MPSFSLPPRLLRSLLLTFGFAAAACPALAQPFIVTKAHTYLQTDTATVGDDPSGKPWSFNASISGAQPTGTSVTPPGGTAQPLFSDGKGGLVLAKPFASQPTLDASYPNGTYQMAVNGKTVAGSLTADAYPNAPTATVTGGAWNANTLQLDPTKDAAITTQFTSNFRSGSAYIRIELDADHSSFSSGLDTASSGFAASALTLTLPKGSVPAGDTYTATITFYNIALLDTSTGTTVALAYETQTSFHVTVGGVSSPPVITQQLPSISINLGSPMNLTIKYSSAGPVTFQWYKDGQILAGETGQSYNTTVTAATAGSYTVTLTNSAGTVTSQPAIVTVIAPAVKPAFTTQPTPLTVAPGSTAILTVQVTGSPAPVYQWYLGSTLIGGATGPRLVLAHVTPQSSGTYSCLATNSAGATASAPAQLTVPAVVPDPGRLINLSVLTPAPFTTGFFSGGAGTSGNQNLLIRATGPALAAFGQTGTSADPALTVVTQVGATQVAANDNWGTPAANGSAVAAADATTQAFPLTAGSLDAAVVAQLPTQGYSVQVAGGSGLALAEIYDATAPGTYTAATPRLTNLSVLTQVSGSGNLTAGFVLGGSSAKSVLIRAIGPGLAPLGVPAALADPQLALHAKVNGQDTVIATNAGWGNDPVLVNLSNSVQAFSIPTNSHDAVLALTLQPNTLYSAVATSASGARGAVIIEVYEIP